MSIDASLFDLTGQVALVTGASSGLGQRFAEVLSGAGAKVALAARRLDRLEGLQARLREAGGIAETVALDVTAGATFEAHLDAIEEVLGPVDILINNAGMNIQSRAIDIREAAYDQLMATNVKGPFLLATAVARRMIARKRGGRIINIASIGAHRVLPGLAIYCMSKAAIAMMTQSLAREWARADINVTAICPGYIETELNSEWFSSEGGQKQIAGFPRKRLGEESDLDGTLLLLASAAGRIMTGSIVTVDDGQSL
ncbi:MAG: SDR family NAD(P)-dependent oxidoreductase [Alphaproteobacteria bacterium]|nr:SDR family NAD(P)-dependent oxidoreductase [Alphaproteobacteria bacterium]